MNVKKIIAASAASVVVATQMLTAVSMAATTANYPAEWVKAVEFMKENGLSSTANSVDQYQPLATVKREAAAKFFVNFAKKFFNKTADTTKVCTFADINEAQAWAVPYIIEACQMGLLKGSNGKFLPKADLTKLQFLTVLARLVKNNPNIEPVQAFNLMKQEGVTKAADIKDTVRPVTRIEIAILFMRAADKYAQTAQQSSNENNDNTNIGEILGSILGNDQNTTTGGTQTASENNAEANTGNTQQTTAAEEDKLVVSLDPATPAEQYVPGTGVDIKAMKVDFVAGSKDVTVKAVTVKLQGMVARDHIDNVYLEDENGAIISNQRGFGTDYTARLVLTNGLVVKAGTTKAIYVAFDVKNSVNELIRISIPSAADVEATSPVDGQFPIVSNVIHTTSYSSETLTFEPELAGTTNTYYVGDTNKEVARFKLTASSEHQKDITVKSVRLKLSNDSTIGVVSTDLDNVKLVVNGQTISKKVVMDGRYVTFTTDYTIPYGESRTFYVYADVIGVQSPQGDTVRFYLDKSSDISALEQDTNAAVNVTGNGTASVMETNNIEEGDNLITKSSESPVPTTIPYDTTDIPVLVANVNVSNPMNVDKFDVYFKVFSGNDSVTDMTEVKNHYVKNVKLYINGKLVDVVSDYGTGTSSNKCEHGKAGYACAEFSYYGELKGSNKFTVKIDTPSTLTSDTPKIDDITIDGNSFVDATYVNTDNVVQTSDIKGEADNGPFTIVKPAIAALTRVDGYSDPDTMVAGATDFDVLGASVQANNVGDLTINTVTIKLYSGSNLVNSGVYNYISTAKLTVDGKVLDTESVNGATITFNSLNIPVAKASTKRFDILLTTTTNLSGAQFKVVVPVNGITATDAAGNTTTNSTALDGVTWNVVGSANLDVTLNSNSPVEQVLAANPNVETEVARFDFKPTYDDAQIQELVVRNAQGSGADSLIQNVYLYDTNGNKLAEAGIASGTVDFNLATPFTLPKDQTTTLVVKVKTNAINSLALTNKKVQFEIATNGNDSTQKTRIISVSNGQEISLSNLPTANLIVFRKTIPTFANGDLGQTTLNNGANNDIYVWKVTADQAGAVKLHSFKIKLYSSNTNTTWSDFELYHNGTKFTSGDVNFTTGDGYVVITFTGSNYENGYEVSAGSTVEFKLSAVINGATGDNDTASARLENEGDTYASGDVDTITSGHSYSVIWSDEAAKGTVTGGTVDWFTDKGILSLPIAAETLSK